MNFIQNGVSHKDEIRLMSEASHHMELEELDKKAMECEKYLLEQGYERGDERARSAVDGEAGLDYDTWHKRLNEEPSGIGYGGINIKEQCRNQEDYREKYLKADIKTPKWETTTLEGTVKDYPGDWDFEKEKEKDPFEYQVGGDHYKNFKIQPAIFCEANELSFFPSSIVKYACRFKQKGGEEDLKKIIHYAEMAREYYYGEKEKD